MQNKKHLILDAMGVIFQEEDDLEIFMPYLEKNSVFFDECSKTQEIHFAYLRLTKGELTSYQFFQDIGIQNPNLDFLLNVTLDSAFFNFVSKIGDKYKLSVLSNDSQEWVNFRNHNLGIDGIFSPYITSNLISVRKPNRKAYEKTLWLLDATPKDCIYVDNLEENLIEPSKLGMDVILFNRNGKINSNFPLVRNFSELNEYLNRGYHDEQANQR